MKKDSLDQLLIKMLKDPEFKGAYDSSEAQYQLTRSIIAERIKQDLSQKELAERAHTTQTVISRLERMTFNPTLELMNRVTKALGKKLTLTFN